MAMRDTDVEIRGDSLAGKKILLGVSGGIAAVDTVRLARELRRHGAIVSVMMTHSAQKIITPLAVEWATQTNVITDWESLDFYIDPYFFNKFWNTAFSLSIINYDS